MKDKRENKSELLMGETSISLSFTSIMTMISFIFIGLLLQGNKDLLNKLKIPLMYLFLSAFAFFYSTLIYANVSGNIARLKKSLAEKQLCVGNAVSEFFGVYFIVFSMPMVIFGYINDNFFSYILFLFGIFGLWFYHQLGYSILGRYVSNLRTFYLLLILTILLHTLNFISFVYNIKYILYLTSIFLVCMMGVFTAYAIHKEEHGTT